MNKPLFSLLIANYNNGIFFKDCYDSIISQTYTNWEVIVVDDASKDNSVELIQNIIGDDTRFKFYQNSENKGCGFTKRRCAELATGEICAFLDPDDAITEEALAIMVAEHEKFPKASMVYSKHYFCDENLKIDTTRESQQVENHKPFYFDFDGYIHHFLSYKKEYYDKTVGIEAYLLRAVDRDLILKLYEVGAAFFIDKALYKYRIHKNGISTNNNQDKAYFWYWVTIIDAAKRRKVNIENLFTEKALLPRREVALQKEIDGYNKSFIFKALRKLGLFKIFVKN